VSNLSDGRNISRRAWRTICSGETTRFCVSVIFFSKSREGDVIV
jgi:hypothetical protein